MVQLFHDHSLINDRLDLLFPRKLVLPHDLHCVETSRILFPDQDDPAESSSTDDLNLLKIVSADFMVDLDTLSECQFGKMSSKKLSILKDM